ncbi:MAG: exodeoxyribonuclease III, partial [Bacteroidales bacterium]|nr:exodeoxyribonuclease III [Bacteroidales bacterium]
SGADVVCLQETKAQLEQIPVMDFSLEGYHSYCFSAQKKGYSGVAILTKKEPKNIVLGMGIEKYDNEGRMIRLDFDNLSVASVYHPSGTSGEERQAFKMQWLEDFKQYALDIQSTIPEIVFCGDYNIAHCEIDIHDPKGNSKNSGFLPEERQWMTDFIASGFTDSYREINPQTKDAYSWWSYRAGARGKNKGWRIDYCMVSDKIKERINDAGIDPSAMQSDHCPIWVEIAD